ncbi:hypothetical protein NLI96_g2858 [Meripilus lineatus]|uniref:NAD(P)-binding protein n=1 Tax=Meripilus lineatus TaxID=2056292 RepID=A0AAD5V7Y4_9APHY|nr:hypothetical protein NLI96_g2858 [Physisporinus lineatus]
MGEEYLTHSQQDTLPTKLLLSIMSTPQIWFITGASSGFGRAMVEHVLEKGDIAIATLRKPEVLDHLKAKYPAPKLLTLALDVTKPSDITNAFNRAQEVFGRIDVVFNNAGYAIVGEVEGTPEETARTLFEVVFWGADRISREAVRFFREVNKPGIGGRLLNNSSMAGLHAHPGLGYYSAAKYALEAISQSLADELDPAWNIKISLIEPGTFTTPAINENNVKVPPHPAYTNPNLEANKVRGFLDGAAAAVGGDPNKAVARFYELAHLDQPPLRFTIGKDAIVFVRQQVERIVADIDQYESWSEGLGFSEDLKV